jgi:hypothetical protein
MHIQAIEKSAATRFERRVAELQSLMRQTCRNPGRYAISKNASGFARVVRNDEIPAPLIVAKSYFPA